eukprot:SAG11_NODE_2186_length_3710_cov_1.860426_3_plen_132_part_00
MPPPPHFPYLPISLLCPDCPVSPLPPCLCLSFFLPYPVHLPRTLIAAPATHLGLLLLALLVLPPPLPGIKNAARCVEVLVDAGTNLRTVSARGATCLHACAHNKTEGCAKVVLKYAGASRRPCLLQHNHCN